MRYSKGKKILFAILIIPLVIFVFVTVVMYLWNWLIPELFNGPVVTFWQAFGLILLSKILFGGFKGGGHRSGPSKWGDNWKQKFKDMSPEERVAFKEKWANKWNCGRTNDFGNVAQESSENPKK